MKQKIFRMFFPALLACFMLAGCKKSVGTPEDNAIVEEEPGEEEEDTGYVFGYSCIDMDNPYFDTLRRSLENTLGENEYRLISKNPGSDAQVQAAQLQELMDEGVDAVFLCPVDWEAVTPALEALQEAGIPVINIDTQVKEESLTKAYIGSDNRNAGYVCGEDLKKRCPGGGKILLLECPSINSINERITGFEQAIANAGFEVLDRADVNGEKEKAKEAMGEFLEKYPKIDGVMCGNDQVALGALEAVKESGRQGIRIYGVDGSPDVKQEIAKPDSPMTATGAQSPIRIGKAAAETGIAILDGEKFETTTYEDTFLIDKGNVEMYGTDGWQ
ncbi:MAG: sugar ABC transporter substrate-binding protein [Ruminococcus sp.]|jgi:ribose transport system substrate-binding protein|uniref:Sugar ABC transporter substrate-binding protein n=1 Tax=Schaedlerella arabinosiphila TaxID=2044587 RepID=A0A426DEW8_9FIRM|nr:sugar ABC transporter substrate-binding protein [Schaedlerella arabinosiphila]MCI8722164.1 sugar ABC transporter substrate-binding protein [Ruminococcus sp.]MCI9211408.1 sugar ABC transporter substrate-binding protein [Ruminococcus sp.]MDE7068317.1 sugar ABC transporter substrate-binding protein [Schaedlerella arabinosiphila]RRK31316.1 sugar ABC transporter substrate-binding protein [Schaedlerella arabinosiphila]